MNALVISQRTPFSLSKFSPQRKLKAPTLLPSIKCQLNAEAKGFTSRKPPQIIKENTQKVETASNKPNRNNEDEELPKEVFNRVIKRILVSVGVPMALGLGLLKFYGTVKEQGIWDVPVWVVFTSTFLTLGASALGIAYGALSTSLDPDKKGSLLGFEEVQENWVEMWKEEDAN